MATQVNEQLPAADRLAVRRARRDEREEQKKRELQEELQLMRKVPFTQSLSNPKSGKTSFFGAPRRGPMWSQKSHLSPSLGCCAIYQWYWLLTMTIRRPWAFDVRPVGSPGTKAVIFLLSAKCDVGAD